MGMEVDHVSVYRWVQTFTPLLVDAVRIRRHGGGDRWFVDETYLKVSARWMYLHRAVDQFGQVIEVVLSEKRRPPRRPPVLRKGAVTLEPSRQDQHRQGQRLPAVIDDLLPDTCHVTDQYATTVVESDYARLKGRLRPVRGLKRRQSVVVVTAAHALVQNTWRGHYEVAVDSDQRHRVADAFDELMIAV